MDHVDGLFHCLRECNVTIRWLMLHRVCRNKEYRELVEGKNEK